MAPGAICKLDRVIGDSFERTFTVHNSLIHTHTTCYENYRRALFVYVQLCRKHHGGYRVRVGKDGHSLHLHNAISDEKCSGHTSHHNRNDIIDAVVLLLLALVATIHPPTSPLAS